MMFNSAVGENNTHTGTETGTETRTTVAVAGDKR
jgi:hypothetical protein